MGNLRTTRSKRATAFGTVEVLLAITLFLMYGTFLIGSLAFSVSATKVPNVQKTATRYAAEGIEVARYIRKETLTNLPDGTYGLSNTGSEWTLSSAPEVVGTAYTRTITISSPTANQKRIQSTVTWSDSGRTGTETLYSLLTNWQDVIIPPVIPWSTPTFNKYHQIVATTYDVVYLKFFNNILYSTLLNRTTSSHFTSFDVSAFPTITQGATVNLNSVMTDTSHRYNSGDGLRRFYYSSARNGFELTGFNANSLAVIGSYNMTNNTDANGVATDQTGTLIYVTRTANGVTNEFNVVQNSGTATFTTLGGINSSSTYYDVIWKNATYAYVSTSNTAGELLVINISNPASPSIAATINLPTSTSGRFKMTMEGNTLALYRNSGTTTGSAIYFYDCSNPAAPTLSGSFTYPYTVYDADIDIARKLLFVVSSNATAEFGIIDFSNPAAPVLRGSYNAPATTYRAVAWDAVNDRAYIGTTDNTNEITILNAN